MALRNTQATYGAAARALHWIVAALLLVQFPLGVLGADLPLGIERLITLSRHKSLGMTLLALVLLRLAWRLADPPPALPAGITPRARRLARSAHLAFYVLLVLVPLLGWIGSSASNLTVSWFGWFTFPDLVGTDPGLAQLVKTCHAWLAWLLLALITVHVVAALRHHFVLHDDVLARMLPWARRTGP